MTDTKPTAADKPAEDKPSGGATAKTVEEPKQDKAPAGETSGAASKPATDKPAAKPKTVAKTDPKEDPKAKATDDLEARLEAADKDLADALGQLTLAQECNSELSGQIAQLTTEMQELREENAALRSQLANLNRTPGLTPETDAEDSPVEIPEGCDVVKLKGVTPQEGDFVVTLEGVPDALVRGCETDEQAVLAFNQFYGINRTMHRHSVSKV